MPALRIALVVFSLAMMGDALAASTCAPSNREPVDTVRQMFVDAAAGDRAKILGAFAADGFLFDDGARFTPEAITDLVLKMEAGGIKPQWRIEGAESHISCDMAWATWTNHGSFTKAAGVDLKTYLESAVFVWHDGAWKIRFFHSTAVSQGQ